MYHNTILCTIMLVCIALPLNKLWCVVDCLLLPLSSQAARKEVAMIKVVAPQMAQRVVDRAMQVSVCGCHEVTH